LRKIAWVIGFDRGIVARGLHGVPRTASDRENFLEQWNGEAKTLYLTGMHGLSPVLFTVEPS
jgi:hypothetical protein